MIWHGSFEVEQQFCVDLGWFSFRFCFLKLFQLWFHFCILSSCNCSSARQRHLSLHRNSFVSAWLGNLLGVCPLFPFQATCSFQILQEATVVGWQLSLRLDSVFEISNRHHSGSECVATGAGIASFCGWLSDVNVKQWILIYFMI